MKVPFYYANATKSESEFYHELLNRELRQDLSDNGWRVPQLSDSDIARISSKVPDGTIWYDSTNHVFVGKINGSLRKFDTSSYP